MEGNNQIKNYLENTELEKIMSFLIFQCQYLSNVGFYPLIEKFSCSKVISSVRMIGDYFAEHRKINSCAFQLLMMFFCFVFFGGLIDFSLM